MVISALLVFMRFCMSIFTYLKRGKGTTVFSEAYFERCWIINWKKTSPSSYSIYPFFWCYWILWFLPKKNMLPLFRRDKITITASLTHTHLCVRQILVGIVFFAAASVLPPSTSTCSTWISYATRRLCNRLILMAMSVASCALKAMDFSEFC